MSEVRYSLGIDPGWKNLGYGFVKEEVGEISLIDSGTLSPADMLTYNVPDFLYSALRNLTAQPVWLSYLTMERYVSYQNVQTAESENILMLMGMLDYGLQSLLTGQSPGITRLHRAIDWKMELVKLLVKNKGFDNPSLKLDKKFSIAAAHACLDNQGTFKTDHEADAICLAALPFLRERYAGSKT